MSIFTLLLMVATLLLGYGCGRADAERRADSQKAEEALEAWKKAT